MAGPQSGATITLPFTSPTASGHGGRASECHGGKQYQQHETLQGVRLVGPGRPGGTIRPPHVCPTGGHLKEIQGRVALLGGFFILAGAMHFVTPGFYLAMMPPWLPRPEMLVAASGVAEIAGGLGVLAARWRRPAGLGLLLLLLAVFPANIQMLLNARAAGEPELLLWLRLPLQLFFLWWVWRVAVQRSGGEGPPGQAPQSRSSD
ncbi:MAG: hypothetical protein ABR551_00390 [Gemmatimonadales bacterium]